MFIKTLKINKVDFAVIAAVVGVSFLVLELVINIIMLTVRPDSVPTLAGTMLPFVAGFLSLFVCASQIPMGFEFVLRYSVTRRRALAATMGLMIVETAFAFVLALLLAQAERAIVYGVWLRAIPSLEVEDFTLPVGSVVVGAVVVFLVGLVCGTALQRFGRKAFWVLWGIWMAALLLSQTLDWEKIIHKSIAAYFPMAALLVILSGLSVWSLLRAAVNN